MTLRARSLAAAAIAIAVAGTAVLAADPIEARKATMKAMGGAVGTLAKMAKGEIPYDAAGAKAAADTMIEKSKSIDVATLFPKGSETGGDTAALPKIWSDPEGFKAALDKMKTAVATEAPKAAQGADQLKTVLPAIGRTCKACHDDYRAQKP